jgi:hypothetical protein
VAHLMAFVTRLMKFEFASKVEREVYLTATLVVVGLLSLDFPV